MNKVASYPNWSTCFTALLLGALAAGCGNDRDPVLGVG
jgi:hypothetical protein